MPQLPTLGLLLVAAERGLAADEGVDLVLQPTDTGRDALRVLASGEADLAAAYEAPVVLSLLQGSPARILTKLHHGTEGTGLVARADRAIRGGADLRGRRVGLSIHTNAESFLRALLASSGVPVSEVTLVDLPPERLQGALVLGEVDAIAVWGPLLFRAHRALGPLAGNVVHSDAYDEQSLLVTRDEVLRARRGALVKLARALVRAEQLAEADPAAFEASLARALPAQDPQDLHAVLQQTSARLGLDNLLLVLLGADARAFSGADADIPPASRLASLLAPSVLLEVAPEAVTVAVSP